VPGLAAACISGAKWCIQIRSRRARRATPRRMFRASGPRRRREVVRRLSREGLLIRVGRKRDMKALTAIRGLQTFTNERRSMDLGPFDPRGRLANYQANRLLRRRWMPLDWVGPRRERA
jgi:hypothetical protein